MPTITRDYTDSLPEIYRDILKSVPRYRSQFKFGGSVAVASLAALLGDKHSYAEVRLACDRMAEAGVLRHVHEQSFVPTEIGDQLVEMLAGGSFPEQTVPDFPPLPKMDE